MTFFEMPETVKSSEIPDHSLLIDYLLIEGSYVDSYARDIEGEVLLDQYTHTFFDSWLFRIERRILSIAGVAESNPDSLKAFALGERTTFSAWHVLQRNRDEILLSAADGIVRTWLCTVASPADSTRTRLYFGSALVPVQIGNGGQAKLPLVFRLSLPFHKLYSRMLLSLAAKRLTRSG